MNLLIEKRPDQNSMGQSMLVPHGSSYLSTYDFPLETSNNYVKKPINRKWYTFAFLLIILLGSVIFWLLREPQVASSWIPEETGYLSFQTSSNQSRTFFYRLTKRSPHHKESACLVLWINGGLGTSSQVGYFAGVGPSKFDPNSGDFTENPQSWNVLCDLVFVDQPMGTGMSNRKSRLNSTKPDRLDLPLSYDQMADDLYRFLEVFLLNRTYTGIRFAGESLSGKVMLRLGSLYLDQKQIQAPELSSVILVSPWIDAPGHYNLSLEYAVDSGMLNTSEAHLLETAKNACVSGITHGNITIEDTQRCFAFYDQVLARSACQSDQKAPPEKYNIMFPASENPYTRLRLAVQKKLQTEQPDFKVSNGDIAKYYAVENHQDDSQWYFKLLFGESTSIGHKNLQPRVKLRVLFGDKDFISHSKAGVAAVDRILRATSERLTKNSNYWTSASNSVQVAVVKDAGHFVCFDAPATCFATLKDLITVNSTT